MTQHNIGHWIAHVYLVVVWSWMIVTVIVGLVNNRRDRKKKKDA